MSENKLDVDDVIQQALADAESFSIDDDSLKGIAKLANEQLRLEQLLAKLEDAVKKTNADLEAVRDYKLPEAMHQAGTGEWASEDGSFRIKLERLYFPAVTKENQAKVYDWMVAHKFDGIIDANVVVPLGKGAYRDGKKLAEELNRFLEQRGVKGELRGDIHWATFRAFAREQAEAPAEDKVAFPPELRVHDITRAKIVMKKKGK